MALLFLSLYTVHIMALHSFITVHIIIILFFLGSPGTIRWLLLVIVGFVTVVWLLVGYCWLLLVGYCWLLVAIVGWLLLVIGYCWLVIGW